MPRTFWILAPVAALVIALAAMVVGGVGRPAPVVTPTATPVPVASLGVSQAPTESPYGLAAGEAWIMIGSADRVTLVRPDGTGAHDILRNTGVSIVDPAWSPDGEQLVFEGNGDAGSQLWVANADGTNLRQATPTPAGCPGGTCIEAVNPAWSPDGTTIAYVAPQHDGGVFTRTAVMVLDLATGTTREVYGTDQVGLGRPTWSPDGKRLAFEIDRYVGAVEASDIKDTLIAVIDVTGGGNPTEITDPTLLAGYPVWHPTDDLLIVRTNRLNNATGILLDPTAPSDIYSLRPDGTRLTRVTNNTVGSLVIRAPSWTPDGRILYTAYDPSDQSETLRVMDADGTNDGSATGATVTEGQGRWRPRP